MFLPGRKYSAGSGYRYGFNGKENDNEVKGDGNQQYYEARDYDTRLGRLFAIDPLTSSYPELTPYQFAENTPIQAVDFLGLQGAPVRNMPTRPTPAIKPTNNVRIDEELLNGTSGGSMPKPNTPISQTSPPDFAANQGGYWVESEGAWYIETPNGGYYERPKKSQLKEPLTPLRLSQRNNIEQSQGVMEFKKSIYSEKPTPLVATTLNPAIVKSPSLSEVIIKDKDTYVYRRGNNTDNNFTIRPGADADVNNPKYGLSVDAVPVLGVTSQKISVKLLNELGLRLSYYNSHISIVPNVSKENMQKELTSWAASKGKTPEGSRFHPDAHKYTSKVMTARVDSTN